MNINKTFRRKEQVGSGKKIEDLSDEELKEMMEEWYQKVIRQSQRYDEYLSEIGFKSINIPDSMRLRKIQVDFLKRKAIELDINKTFREKKSSNVSPVTRLNWAMGLHRDAQIVLADNGRYTMIGAKYDDETHFIVECDESEIEGILKSLDRRPVIVNYKVPAGKKSVNMDTRKVVVTQLHPGSVLRLYWRIPTALSETTDIFWTDCGRSTQGPEEELFNLLAQNKIDPKDVIRKDR